MNKSYVTALLLASANAASWDYSTNGADWPSIDAACGGSNQSPINLISEGSEGFNYEVIGKDDIVDKSYANQKNVAVNWNGHTSQVDLNAGTTNKFESLMANELFGADTVFNGA